MSNDKEPQPSPKHVEYFKRQEIKMPEAKPFTKITDYTDEELKYSQQRGILICSEKGLDFWKLFNAFDAVLEIRRRKELAKNVAALQEGSK